MNPLELTPDEQTLLAQVLRRHLSDLEMEICHTDRADFRQLLRQRRETLHQILAKVANPAPVAV